MKIKLIIIMSCILSFSCTNSTNKEKELKTNELKSAQENKVIKQAKNKTKSSYEIAMLKMDSTIRVLCDTSFLIKDQDTLKTNETLCPFKPYMLVVNDGQLKILNYSLDSIYTIKSDIEVHTATWSPINKSEIFLLLREKVVMSQSDSIDFPFCCVKPPFDLKLYRLNLDSLKMYGVTSFYNKIIPLIKLQYEIGEFFPRNSTLKFDSENNIIYYDAIPIMMDYDDFVNKGTYIADLKSGKTSLTKPLEFEQEKKIGDLGKIYSNAYHQDNNFKARVKNKIIQLFDIPSKTDTIEISSKLFKGNEQMDIEHFEIDTVLNRLQFNYCYTNDSGYIIGSPYTEHEMAVLNGNIYLINKNTQDFKVLVNNRVIGYSADFYTLDNGMNIISSYWDLQIYDKNFSLKFKFPKIQYYEIK